MATLTTTRSLTMLRSCRPLVRVELVSAAVFALVCLSTDSIDPLLLLAGTAMGFLVGTLCAPMAVGLLIKRLDFPIPPSTYLSGVRIYALPAGSSLAGANLRYSDLSDLDLSDQDLRKADLRDSKIRGVSFRRANLRYADLRHSSSSKSTSFDDANLDFARFLEADLPEEPQTATAKRDRRQKRNVETRRRMEFRAQEARLVRNILGNYGFAVVAIVCATDLIESPILLFLGRTSLLEVVLSSLGFGTLMVFLLSSGASKQRRASILRGSTLWWVLLPIAGTLIFSSKAVLFYTIGWPANPADIGTRLILMVFGASLCLTGLGVSLGKPSVVRRGLRILGYSALLFGVALLAVAAFGIDESSTLTTLFTLCAGTFYIAMGAAVLARLRHASRGELQMTAE